jgi:hypothetical protein
MEKSLSIKPDLIINEKYLFIEENKAIHGFKI